MKDKALLVIDMQVDLCYDPRRKDKVMKMISPLQMAIKLFNSHQFPVFYICFELPDNDEQFERFGDIYCVAGTKGAEIIPELQPYKGVIVKKRKHSAFFETGLDELLNASKVKEVYLSGLQTHICIMTTAADASFRGYRAIAIDDCVVSSREENKQQALSWIDKYVGQVMSLDEVIKEFNNDKTK